MFLIALDSFWRSRKLKFHGKYWNFIISAREIMRHALNMIQGCITVQVYGYEAFDIAWAWKHSVQVHQLKGYRDMKKLLHAHEYYLTIISWHASFSEREGDWGSHGMFMPGMVKKERERERSHVGHACQPGIRIVMPGMKMNEMSYKKRTKE